MSDIHDERDDVTDDFDPETEDELDSDESKDDIETEDY
jgi:hypothetical protein